MSEHTRSLLGLDGQVAVITGAGSGIGRATAELFLSLGSHVVAADRDEAALTALALEYLDTAASPRLSVRPLDVTQAGACRALVRQIHGELGRIDLMVTSAGVVRPDLPDGPGTEDYDLMFDTNVRGTLNMAAATKHAMIAQRSGSMVLLGSVVGNLGWSARSVYCATKGAIHAMTRALAVELAPASVRVNAIAPGLVWTPMIERVVTAAPDPERAFIARCVEQANGRMLTASEVARAVLFFASAMSAPATGCVHDLSVGRAAGHIPSIEHPGPDFAHFRAERFDR